MGEHLIALIERLHGKMSVDIRKSAQGTEIASRLGKQCLVCFQSSPAGDRKACPLLQDEIDAIFYFAFVLESADFW